MSDFKATAVAQGQILARTESERLFIGFFLFAFAACWLAFDIISKGPLGAHFDLSEMSIWAEHLALGYKHPPLSGWIFAAWFSLFPRTVWAADLLAVCTVTVTLAITWRLLRDHMDFNRSVLGLASLTLVPLYTFHAAKFNANLVMMPFWAACSLFYLRARIGFRIKDAALAGIFLALAFLGKYWAIYLVIGVATACFTGPKVIQFWKSPSPYIMASCSLIVVTPHLLWLLYSGGKAIGYVEALDTHEEFAASLLRSIHFLVGAVAYVIVPLLLYGTLRPGRLAISDTLHPECSIRKIALVLLTVPLIVPAIINLHYAHRLTALWTFPNWSLLPIVLYGSPKLIVSTLRCRHALLAALAGAIAPLVFSPLVGIHNLSSKEIHRAHWQQISEELGVTARGEIHLGGDPEITKGLYFYLPHAKPLQRPDQDVRIGIVCLKNDVSCKALGDEINSLRWKTITLRQAFLGFKGPPITYQIKAGSRNLSD